MPATLLLLIDLQRAADHPAQGLRNNPQAEKKIARLLAHWRANAWPVWHIKHDSREPLSHYRPGQPGNDLKPEAMPLPQEPVIVKHTNNAFIGTDLEQRLNEAGLRRIAIAGVSTINSVEATVRMAGNLDYQVWLVEDACFTFAKRDWNGTFRSAEEIHAMSLANLDGEYCTVTTTDAMIG